jgi:uncharacterized protein involved in outer membrane biogenesis
MSRRSWWIAAAIGVVGLPAIAAGIAVAVIDPNDYKQQIAAAVQTATGRELTLGGTLRIGLSLWPTIEISDVKLANLPGGSRPDMVRVEKIEARLLLSELLFHRVEITRLTMVGPNILFELVDGKPNWILRPEPTPGSPQSNSPSLPVSLRIRDFRVVNGMITSRMPARTKVLGIRTLRLQHPNDGGSLDLSAVFVYSDYQPFTLTASAQPTAGLGGPWTTRLDFAAYDARASAKGTMSLSGKYDLRIDATAPELEKLNALLPEMRLPALHQTTLSTHLTNGPVNGDLPVIGASVLHIGSADLGDIASGLKLDATDVSLPAAGGLATLSGHGSFAGQPFSIDGTFGVPEHPDGRVAVPIDLTAQAPPAPNAAAKWSLSLNGAVTLKTGSFDGLDAASKFGSPALVALRPIISQKLPALTGVTLDGKVVVAPDAGSISLSGAKLSSREGDLAGDTTIGLGPAIAMKGKLHSTRLDADAILKAFGIDPRPGAGSTANPGGPLIPDTTLPWAMLRGPNIDLAATVGTMTFQQQALHDLELAVTLKDSKLTTGRLWVALPAGPVETTFTADASTDTVPVSVTMRSPGIPLSLIARYAGLPDEMSGAVRVETQLRAAGRNPREMATSLSGPLNATMIGGKLSNAALIRLASPSLQALNIDVPAQGETDIRCLGLVGSFDKGVGRFSTIAVDSTYLELTGSGQVDLGAETAVLKLHPTAQISGSPVSVPVVVEGPLRSLRGRLDASGLDQVGLFIDALFGGDKPHTCSDAGLVAATPIAP